MQYGGTLEAQTWRPSRCVVCITPRHGPCREVIFVYRQGDHSAEPHVPPTTCPSHLLGRAALVPEHQLSHPSTLLRVFQLSLSYLAPCAAGVVDTRHTGQIRSSTHGKRHTLQPGLLREGVAPSCPHSALILSSWQFAHLTRFIKYHRSPQKEPENK